MFLAVISLALLSARTTSWADPSEPDPEGDLIEIMKNAKPAPLGPPGPMLPDSVSESTQSRGVASYDVATGGETATAAADVEAIKRKCEGWGDAFNAGDVDSWMEPLTDDVMFMPPNRPPLGGKDAIRSHYQALFDANDFDVSFEIQEVVVSGSWAFVRGTNTGVRTAKAGGDPAQVSIAAPDGRLAVKFIWILQKQGDRSWKISHNIYNNDKPLPGK